MSLFTQLKLGLNKYIKKRIKRTPSVFYLHWPTLWVQTLAKIHAMILNIPVSSPAWNLCCINFGFGQIPKIKFKIPEKNIRCSSANWRERNSTGKKRCNYNLHIRVPFCKTQQYTRPIIRGKTYWGDKIHTSKCNMGEKGNWLLLWGTSFNIS